MVFLYSTASCSIESRVCDISCSSPEYNLDKCYILVVIQLSGDIVGCLVQIVVDMVKQLPLGFLLFIRESVRTKMQFNLSCYSWHIVGISLDLPTKIAIFLLNKGFCVEIMKIDG